ncbi:hypothetical protein Tco_1121402 [Tanacetum coccineum]|uniref:Uncharacterized protein n=1 Tax=Tanacetum coccineum TaxID=301880 RepID=A0ABQ5IXN1_9ASTR
MGVVSRGLSDFAEKYGSKTGCLAGFGIGGKAGERVYTSWDVTERVAKPAKKKQTAKTSKDKGLTMLSEVALTEAEQMELATKRSLIQTYSSHASISDDDEIAMSGDDDDADNQEDDDNHDDDQNDDNTDNENDDNDDEESDEVTHGTNVEGEELDEEEKNEEDEENELYRDVNINLDRRDTKMTDDPCTIIQSTQVIEDTHVLITPINPEVDVLVTTITETPLSSATTLPSPTIPLITHLQQTLIPTLITVSSSSLQDLPNFGSLFGFDHRLKTLETDFLEFKQTNQFAAAVSSIPGIIDAYLANKMHEAVKTADRVKEQVKAQVSKILPKIKKTVNEQLEVEVLTRSSNESKTSHAVAANLSELELKKILIDKMESNKSIHRSDEQKNLYNSLVNTYKSDKYILDTYGDTVLFKRRQDDEDKDEEPSAGSNWGSKRRRAGKEPESTIAPKEKTSKTVGKSTKGSKSHHKSAGESAEAKEPKECTAKDLEEPAHQEFETGVTEDQPDEETSQLPDWFPKPAKPPTPNRDWNKTLPDTHGPV